MLDGDVERRPVVDAPLLREVAPPRVDGRALVQQVPHDLQVSGPGSVPQGRPVVNGNLETLLAERLRTLSGATSARRNRQTSDLQ